ncbi:DUF1553 domain-containing protein [Lignipirellula cremea]|uniref:NPCBM/NEW2 domain protein n=1 Tax=Lignipirellula cremea TaxID=2528010 RepID=A0A518DM64_9BACT|nr:DUF1553 domain-containing protein [Lignipirellula cremea]QDU92925.1 NPCBM/NEW2 domain protein [Lignipirellula cremea]
MPTCRIVCAVSFLLLGAAGAFADEQAGIDFFEAKIRPVLVQHCYECHAADSKPLQGGLRLDSRQAMRQGGDSGAAVTPNSVDDSSIVAALRYEDYEMPPKGKLDDAVITDFVKWIEMGAPDPREGEAPVAVASIDFDKAAEFWAFQPPQKAPLPPVQQADWPQNPIDYFVLAQLEQSGLRPVPAADRRDMIRRASFDLRGLPPTPEETAAFLADESPEAYRRLIERLLESPHYGERWGRYWLDVARYAEDQAHTFAVKPSTSAWRYRQWVIDALNADMPYDQFVRYQIAGDQLEDTPGFDRYVALGYFGLGAVYYKNSDKAKAEADELDDRIDTLTRGFLGLTVSCARCHDHKFDPIPTRDYYSLAGIFKSSPLANVPLAEPEVVRAYDMGQRDLKLAEKNLADRTTGLREAFAEEHASQIAAYMLAIRRQQTAAAGKKSLSNGKLAEATGLEEEFLKLWINFLGPRFRGKHPALAAWEALPAPTADEDPSAPSDQVKQVAAALQAEVVAVLKKRDGDQPKEAPAKVNGGKPIYASPVLTAQQPQAKIDVPLAGARQLFLVITDAGDGKNTDHANWAEPKIVTADGVLKLTDLEWKTVYIGHGKVHANHSISGGVLQIGETKYPDGIGAHAPCLISVELPEGAERFQATVGLNSSATRDGSPASVEFMVFTSTPPPELTQDSSGAAPAKPDAPKLSKPQAELLKAVFADGGLFRLGDKQLEETLQSEQVQELASLRDKVEEAKQAAPPLYPQAHAIRDANPQDLPVFLRGNPAHPGEPAPRQFLRILSGEDRTPYSHGSGRLELADDIASPGNPLTARVIVNRVWQQHFGRGLVGTASNFGHLGERPSHPQLLDWLAVDFMEHGWSLKHLHRTIMLSAVYRASSENSDQNAEIDGDNRLLWRMSRRRLDVEAWRDALLAASGNLDRTLGGENAPLTGNRRTVYARISRHNLDELLRLFDFPDANVTSAKRTVTTVPQQQLFVLNSDFIIKQAQSLAKRLQAEADTDEARIDRAFQLLYARLPEPDERQLGLDFLAASAVDAKEQKIDPWQQYAQALLSLNEFMYID